MQYNNETLPKYIETAGKITIVTALAGVAIFLFALVFDFGSQELSRVSAQSSATTSLTVLNTPPSFTINAYEIVESSTSSPTNSGTQIRWTALANDSNDAPYFLLICSTNATPTARAAINVSSLGTQPPRCSPTSTIQWGVSAATPSDSYATVATTTVEGGLFAEVNNWYAWVCDDDPFNPRCNNVPVQGFSATNSSPFNMNRRPVFTSISNNGPANPGANIVFSSVATDPDVTVDNDIKLVICQTAGGYSTTTNNCTAGQFIASTTLTGIKSNPHATYTLPAIIRDQLYSAHGFIVDQFGHEATANPRVSNFTVNNVAPVVLGGDIIFNGTNNLQLTVEGGETTGFTLDFSTSDANSCVNAASTTEITNYVVSVFRSNFVSTTTCNGLAGTYNPNYCYPSGVGPTVWNLSCTSNYATACTGPTVDTIDWTCTFPLWFVADPTDAGPLTPTAFADDIWVAAAAGVDDDFATGTLATTTNPKELLSFAALDLLAGTQIPYGALEPGQANPTLSASTTVLNLGNTGLDQQVQGESMCGTFSVNTECRTSATTTIPESEQKFSSSSLAYNSPGALRLSSSTAREVEINVLKTTATNTLLAATGTTYWGIAVPGSITLAGVYQGLNTFTARVAEAIDWTP